MQKGEQRVLCQRGFHEMTGDNVKVTSAGRRYCKACRIVTRRRRKDGQKPALTEYKNQRAINDETIRGTGLSRAGIILMTKVPEMTIAQFNTACVMKNYDCSYTLQAIMEHYAGRPYDIEGVECSEEERLYLPEFFKEPE